MLICSNNSHSGYISTHRPARPIPHALTLSLTCMLLISALILSGCAGVTSAKVNSVASGADASNASASAVVRASPAAVDFGNVPLGATMNQSLTISNSGTAAVTFVQVGASGGGLTIGGVALPVILTPGVSATFTASFTPSATGDVGGGVSFVSQQLRKTFGVGWHGTGKAAAPLISAEPVNASILAGQTATFSVTVNGTSPLSYQWNKNGAAISSATSSTYTTPAAVTSDNGAQFTVVVSNSAVSVVSSIATLSVSRSSVAPSLTPQPTNPTIFPGPTSTFFVVAKRPSPPPLQWHKKVATT